MKTYFSLKSKLLLIISVSLLAFLINFSFITYKGYQEYKANNRKHEYAKLSLKVADFINEVAKERGLSTIYTASKIKYFKNELLKERNILDAKLIKLQEALQNSSLPIAKTIQKHLSSKLKNLEKIRNNVIMNPKDYNEVFSFYSKVIEESYIFFKNPHEIPEIYDREIYPIDRIKNIEEKLRAYIGIGLAKGVNEEIEDKINEYCNEKQLIFISHISPSLDSLLHHEIYLTPLGLKLKKITKNLKSGKKAEISPEKWWKLKTEQIENLKNIEFRIIKKAIAKTASLQEKTKKKLFLAGTFFISFLFTITLLFFYTLKDIYKNIAEIKTVTAGIIKGDFNKKMDEKIPGELGEIAKNVNRIIETFKKFTNNEKIFIASVSHELRTPLNGIIGFLNLLTESKLPEEQQEYVENAEKSAQQLLGLIEDLLDTTKIQTGQMEIKENEFDLNEIIQDVIIGTSSRKNSLKVKFINKIPMFKHLFIGDKKRIKQVLFNLLSNAFKYTKEGNIELGIKSIKENKNYQDIEITFYVKDTGIGIPKEKQKKIFKPFSRISSLDAANIGGTGLGLYISKSLAKLMGGDIWFESETGQGSIFYFSIKLRKGREKTEEEKQGIQASLNLKLYDFSNLKVLAVEDEPINRRLIEKIFEKTFNLKIEIAENGFEAYKKAKENDYDVIFLDIQMPVMDGFETLKRLRKAGIKTPIFMLTADAYKDTEIKTKKLGANGYITKPINVKNLIGILAKIKEQK